MGSGKAKTCYLDSCLDLVLIDPCAVDVALVLPLHMELMLLGLIWSRRRTRRRSKERLQLNRG